MTQAVASLLIVEDDPDVAEMLATFFGGKGYQVVTAGGGEEGIAACRAHRADLIILDVRLPDIDGPEGAPALHNNLMPGSCPGPLRQPGRSEGEFNSERGRSYAVEVE